MSTQESVPVSAFIGKAAVIHQTTRSTAGGRLGDEGKAIRDLLKKEKAMKKKVKDEDASNMAVMLLFVQALIKCMSPKHNPERNFLYGEMDRIETQMKHPPHKRDPEWLTKLRGHLHQTAMACPDRI